MTRPIGIVLKELREQCRLSQGQLAYKAGLTKSAISQIEAAKVKPKSQTLARLAGVLGASTDHILIEAGLLEPSSPDVTTYSPAVRALQCALDSLPEGSDAKRHLEDIIISLGIVAEQAAKQAGEEPNERPHPTTDGSGSPTSHRQRTP